MCRKHSHPLPYFEKNSGKLNIFWKVHDLNWMWNLNLDLATPQYFSCIITRVTKAFKWHSRTVTRVWHLSLHHISCWLRLWFQYRFLFMQFKCTWSKWSEKNPYLTVRFGPWTKWISNRNGLLFDLLWISTVTFKIKYCCRNVYSYQPILTFLKPLTSEWNS